MRTTLLALVVLGTMVPLAAFAPTATAVGTCSEFTEPARCPGWIVCVGYQWSSTTGFRCTGVGVHEPCSYDCWLP